MLTQPFLPSQFEVEPLRPATAAVGDAAALRATAA